MAIDEQIAAEHALGLLDQPAQRLVVGLIEALDAPFGFGEAQLLGVDFSPLATMRAIVPSPMRTRGEPALTKLGNASENIAGSSS